MHMTNLRHAPPSLDAAATVGLLILQTGRLDALNRVVSAEIAHHEMTRARLEALIERLIEGLDGLDEDPDLEDDGPDVDEDLEPTAVRA